MAIRSFIPSAGWGSASSLLAETLGSSTFRLALICIGVFGALVLALFGYVEVATETYLLGRSDRVIDAELERLARAAVSNPTVLPGAIRQRVVDGGGFGVVYLLVDPAGRRVAGNLQRWPEALARRDGWAGLRTPHAWGSAAAGHAMRVRAATLADKSRLLVGAEVDDLVRFGKKMDLALAATIVLVFVLAGVAGIAVTRRTVGRINAINRTSRDIMRSGPGRRIARRGSNDEWDQLAENLNSMLDRIEALMGEVKQVTDNVAHDLRTPLTRMRGRLEAARGRARERAADQRLIADTMADLDTVLAMFASLMRISQIETSDRTSAFRRIDLAAIARDVAELFDAAAEQKGSRLQVRGDRQATLLGDRDLLFDALANLVDNALKHTPAAGEVTVDLRDAANGAVITVRDDGPGIPPDERDRVLRRFYRLERSRGTPGFGLGLSLVAAVAHLHGARIDMHGNEPGLAVRLTFPPPSAEVAGADAAIHTPDRAQNGGG